MLKNIIFALLLASCVLTNSASDLSSKREHSILSKIAKKFQAVKETQECIVCLALVDKAKSFLDEGKTQDELFQTILKTCSLFSGTLNAQVIQNLI